MRCEVGPLARLRLDRDFYFQDGSVAHQIYVRAEELYHHDGFASWFTKVVTETNKPTQKQLGAIKEILYEHAPTIRFVHINEYNLAHAYHQKVEEDVFAFCPRDVSGEEHALVFNRAWFPTLLDPPGLRTDLQRKMFVALGVVTFLHELAHFCIGHTNEVSPLTASAGKSSEPALMEAVALKREPKDYEYLKGRNNREAGFRLEEYVFGGRPALDALHHVMRPDSVTLSVHEGERVFAYPFQQWEAILGDTNNFFALFPRPAVIPSPSMEVPAGRAPMSVRCSCGGLASGRRMPTPPPLPAKYATGWEGRQRAVLVRPQSSSDFSKPAQE